MPASLTAGGNHLMRWTVILALVPFLAGCATADFSDGVTAFATATTNIDNSETALAKADQQAQLDQWYAAAAGPPRMPASVDLGLCIATAYHAGDCRVTVTAPNPGGGSSLRPAPISPVESSMPAIKAYSAQLSAVVADQSCSTLKSDASSLATQVTSLAKLAKVADAAAIAAAGPIATVASTLGCWEINHAQLQILKTATLAADPYIQQLVPLIANKDRLMASDVADIRLNQLQQALLDYRSAGPTTLPQLVQMASAVDTARTGDFGAQINKLAKLHSDLKADLQNPKVTLKRIGADATALATDAQTLEIAYAGLTTGAVSTPAKKPAS